MFFNKRRHQRLKIFLLITVLFLAFFRRHVIAGVHLAAMPLLFKLGDVANPLTLEGDHFDVTFQNYSAEPDSSDSSANYAVPPIIHNVFIGSNSTLRPAWEEARRSCRAQHPNFTFEFWNEERAKDFVEHQFPSIWPTWRDYKLPIQKADSLRYMLLYHYGGIFMDMDLFCVRPLTPLRQFDFVAAAANPSGLSNGFIMSKPRLPFMAEVIQSLKPYDLSWFNLPYVTVSFSTGCHYLSTLYASTSAAQRTNLRVLQGPPSNPRLHQLNGNATTPIFRHLGSSSWHSWDAAVFKSFRHNQGISNFLKGSSCVVGLTVFPLVVVLLALVVVVRSLVREVSRRRALGQATWGWSLLRKQRGRSRKRTGDFHEEVMGKKEGGVRVKIVDLV